MEANRERTVPTAQIGEASPVSHQSPPPEGEPCLLCTAGERRLLCAQRK